MLHFLIAFGIGLAICYAIGQIYRTSYWLQVTLLFIIALIMNYAVIGFISFIFIKDLTFLGYLTKWWAWVAQFFFFSFVGGVMIEFGATPAVYEAMQKQREEEYEKKRKEREEKEHAEKLAAEMKKQKSHNKQKTKSQSSKLS